MLGKPDAGGIGFASINNDLVPLFDVAAIQ